MTVTKEQVLGQMAFQNDLLALSAAVEAANNETRGGFAEAAAEGVRLAETAKKAARLQREMDRL